MKIVIAVFVGMLAVPLIAQQKPSDMPPVITVQITSEEQAEIDASDKAVDKAEFDLAQAKENQSKVGEKIFSYHRSKMNLPWPDCVWMGGSMFTFNGPPAEHLEPKGYIAERRGKWIVFTRANAECHGA
jgi:hypothetical protein